MNGGKNSGWIDQARPIRLNLLACRVNEEEGKHGRTHGAQKKPARFASLKSAHKGVTAPEQAKEEDYWRCETGLSCEKPRTLKNAFAGMSLTLCSACLAKETQSWA